MEPEFLRADLKQEVILIICGLPDEKLYHLYVNNELDFYTVKVILNQIKSNTSPFFKKYREFTVQYAEVATYSCATEINDVSSHISYASEKISIEQWENEIDLEERQVREDIEDMAIEEVDKQYWYNKALINLYMKHGNFRSIQKETGIPWMSCYKTIKKSLKEIKEKVTQ